MTQFIVEQNIKDSIDSPDAESSLSEQIALLCTEENGIMQHATYITMDKIYLVCGAQSKEHIKRKAMACGFVIHRIGRILRRSY